MDKLLTNHEVLKLAGRDAKVLLYPEIQNYDTLDQLFGNKNKIIILYLNEKTPKATIGHWVLLTRVYRNGKQIIEFNDSYGGEIDSQLEYHNEEKREQLDQEHGYLSRLLYNHCIQDEANREIHYNELQLQKLKPNINTCGRFCGIRAHFYEIPLEKYQLIFKKLEDENYDLDDLIVKLSNKILQLK